METIKDKASASGKESHTPESCMNSGKMSRQGMRNSTCLERLMKMDLGTSPTAWKRLVHTIWKPAHQNMMVVSRRALSVTAMR